MKRLEDGTIVYDTRQEMTGSLATIANAPMVCLRSVRDPNRVLVVKDRHGKAPRFEDLETIERNASGALVLA